MPAPLPPELVAALGNAEGTLGFDYHLPVPASPPTETFIIVHENAPDGRTFQIRVEPDFRMYVQLGERELSVHLAPIRGARRINILTTWSPEVIRFQVFDLDRRQAFVRTEIPASAP